jgi:hypothetical protein
VRRLPQMRAYSFGLDDYFPPRLGLKQLDSRRGQRLRDQDLHFFTAACA